MADAVRRGPMISSIGSTLPRRVKAAAGLMLLLPQRCHRVGQGEQWQDRGNHEKGERDKFTQIVRLRSVGISICNEAAKAYPE